MSIKDSITLFLSGLIQKATPFDPAVFGDPLAAATQWTPASAGGSSFCTHRLKKIDPMTLEFRTTFGMKLFCFVFAGMGAMFTVLPTVAIYKQYRGFHLSALFSSLFGLLFVAIGIGLYWWASRPIVFDLKRRVYYKGCKSAAEPATNRKGLTVVDMNRIGGLQILSEYCSGNKSSYYSYELNLVLDDASRVNVVDHGDIRALREDAALLGESLGVPVWDVQASRAAAKTETVKKDPW